jgi:excisionase family DNA binding protein
MVDSHDPERLLTPSEVASIFGVHPKTVHGWARAGRISSIKTLGGNWRYRASEIRRLRDELASHAES